MTNKEPIELNDFKALRANRELRNKVWCQQYLHDNHPGIVPLFERIWTMSKGKIEDFENYADHFNSMTGAELIEELKKIGDNK